MSTAAGAPVLVVNADDYGLTAAVSQGILRAHHEGICTSASVLVLGRGFGASVGWLRDEPALGVGVHLALVGEDPPLLSAREIPTLVDRDGRLPISWRVLLPKVAARRVDPDDIARELAAQIEAVRAEGLAIDHLDSHQHVHMFPVIRPLVVDLARRFGVPAVRVTRSASRGPVGVVMRRLAARLERELAAGGLGCTVASAGLDEAGALDTARTLAALDLLAGEVRAAPAGRGPARAAELSGHPGAADDPDRDAYRWNYRWGDELAALCAPEVRAAVERHGFRLGTYRDVGGVAA